MRWMLSCWGLRGLFSWKLFAEARICQLKQKWLVGRKEMELKRTHAKNQPLNETALATGLLLMLQTLTTLQSR